MRKASWILSLLLVLGFSLSMVFYTPVEAIGEVTPTPDPETATEEPQSDIDIEELVDEGFDDIQNGDYRSALAKMDVVIEADDTATSAYLIRGVANQQLGFSDDALDDFTRAIELEPWQEDYFLFRGEVYTASGSPAEALLDFEQAIRINPFSTTGYLGRSNANFELGDSTAGDVDDLIARALNAFGTGDALTALGFLDEAIELGDSSEALGNAYYIRAIANSNLGDEDAMFDDYTLAIETDPNLHVAHLARGIAYRESGDIQTAGQDFFNRMTVHRSDTVEEQVAIGDTTEIEMAYRRVYEISFDGSAGQVVTLSASDTTVVTDPLITLVDPAGNPIAGDDDFGTGLNSRIEDFELPTDGTYILQVSHAEGGSIVGFNGIVEVEITQE